MNQKSLFSDLPILAVYKDRESRFISITKHGKSLLGFSENQDIEGLTDTEIPCPVSELAHEFRSQDREVMAGKELSIIDIHDYADGKKAFITRKQRTLDSEGKVSGLVCVGQEIKTSEWRCLMQRLSGCTRDLQSGVSWEVSGRPFETFGLSPRLAECLFWMLRGRPAREIAEIMGISKRTVESYTEDIKNKLCCRKKSEVVEKAVSSGYLYQLPAHMIRSGKSVLVSG